MPDLAYHACEVYIVIALFCEHLYAFKDTICSNVHVLITFLLATWEPNVT